MNQRASGVLLPLFSLPGDDGIGSMGEAAYRYIDFLKEAGQTYWQILPLGPTSYGDSPYQSYSTYAGNPYFIDLDMLAEEGLLTKKELAAERAHYKEGPVDYPALYENRFSLLKKAFRRGQDLLKEEICRFRLENVAWIEDYALFMSIKQGFGMCALSEWPDAKIKKREPEALLQYREKYAEEMDFWVFLQFLFFRQWKALRAYAARSGIRLIGDLPIYVAADSADLWSEPAMFQLDEELNPSEVAGCPPDSFNDKGQLWGNPLYDYEAMEKDGFGWWIRRVAGAAALYDMIRIDHFRGMESYWAVPADAEDASFGRWRKGPGMKLVGVLTSWFSDTSFIAEDLGNITPPVRALLKDSELPGMSVLEFAFEGDEESIYLPHNLEKHSSCYLGTHDNDTAQGWFDGLHEKDRKFARDYMNLKGKKVAKDMIRVGMASAPELFVLQAQDLLELGSEARINTPGVSSGNWRFRMSKEQFGKLNKTAPWLYEVTKTYFRLPERSEDSRKQ